jgi:hypothetical protein
MITGKDAWDFAKRCQLRLPFGFAAYYRMTRYSEWMPSDYKWCMERDYYYEQGKDTGKHTLEACLHVRSPHFKYGMSCSLREMNEFEFHELGFKFINEAIDI